MKNQMIKLWFT